MQYVREKTGLSAASLFVLAFAAILAASLTTATGCHATPAHAATAEPAPAAETIAETLAAAPPVIFLPAPAEALPAAPPGPAVEPPVVAPVSAPAAEVCDPNDPNSSCRQQARSVSVLVRRSVSGDCGDCGAFGRLKAAGGRVVKVGKFLFGRERRQARRANR